MILKNGVVECSISDKEWEEVFLTGFAVDILNKHNLPTGGKEQDKVVKILKYIFRDFSYDNFSFYFTEYGKSYESEIYDVLRDLAVRFFSKNFKYIIRATSMSDEEWQDILDARDPDDIEVCTTNRLFVYVRPGGFKFSGNHIENGFICRD